MLQRRWPYGKGAHHGLESSGLTRRHEVSGDHRSRASHTGSTVDENLTLCCFDQSQERPHLVRTWDAAIGGSEEPPREVQSRRSGRPDVAVAPGNVLDGLASGAVVIDTGNYYPKQRDGKIERSRTAPPKVGGWQTIFGQPVVKAFNGIYASHLLTHGKPAGTPGRIALPVAGDDPAANALVIGLLDQLGFDGVDAGRLDDSWRQQPGTPVYGADLDADGVRKALADASPERPLDFRA